MQFKRPLTFLIVIAFLVLITAVALLTGVLQNTCLETFETVPLIIDKNTNKVANGYYQIDDKNMALIPYGYAIDPSNSYNIIPVTKTAKSSLSNKNTPNPPPIGEPLPDGFYKLSDASLAILPPNMLPNIKSIDFSGNPPKLFIYYDTGYVSETQFYKKTFKPANYPSTLPPKVYYADKTNTLISFLPYGKIADVKNGYGMIDDHSLKLNADPINYREIKANYDTQFHDSVETIIAQNPMYDISFGQTKVLDQSGRIIILPSTKVQGSITYYKPGEFPFGASKYVPNYEDGIYLSNVGNRTAFGKSDQDKIKEKQSRCSAYTKMKAKMDEYCGGYGQIVV